MKPFRTFQNSAGMSLTEVLIGMASVGGMMMAVMALNQVQHKSIEGNRKIASRDALRFSAERYLRDIEVLSRSAKSTLPNNAGNVALLHCLKPPAEETDYCKGPNFPDKCCVQTTEAEPQPFFILDPAQPAKEVVFSGTDESTSSSRAPTSKSPASYNVDGMPCAAGAKGCDIEIVSNYVANCPDGAARCKQATSLMIQFEIRQAAASLGKGTLIKTIPQKILLLNPEFKALTAAVAASGSSGGGSGASAPPSSSSKRELRFTEAMIPVVSADSVMHAQCESEFGADYKAANAFELASRWRGSGSYGGFAKTAFILIAERWNNQMVYQIADSLVYRDASEINSYGPWVVACALKPSASSSQVFLTEKRFPAATSDAEMNTQCETEFGSDFKAGRAIDVAEAWGGISTYGGFAKAAFFLIAKRWSNQFVFQATPTGLTYRDSSEISSYGPWGVACVRK